MKASAGPRECSAESWEGSSSTEVTGVSSCRTEGTGHCLSLSATKAHQSDSSRTTRTEGQRHVVIGINTKRDEVAACAVSNLEGIRDSSAKSTGVLSGSE